MYAFAFLFPAHSTVRMFAVLYCVLCFPYMCFVTFCVLFCALYAKRERYADKDVYVRKLLYVGVRIEGGETVGYMCYVSKLRTRYLLYSADR